MLPGWQALKRRCLPRWHIAPFDPPPSRPTQPVIKTCRAELFRIAFFFPSSWSHKHSPCSPSLHRSVALSSLHLFFPPLLCSLLVSSCLLLLIWLNDDIWHSIVIKWNDSPRGSWQTQRGNWYQQTAIGSFFANLHIFCLTFGARLYNRGICARSGRTIFWKISSPGCRQQILWSKVRRSPCRERGSQCFLCNGLKR